MEKLLLDCRDVANNVEPSRITKKDFKAIYHDLFTSQDRHRFCEEIKEFNKSYTKDINYCVQKVIDKLNIVFGIYYAKLLVSRIKFLSVYDANDSRDFPIMKDFSHRAFMCYFREQDLAIYDYGNKLIDPIALKAEAIEFMKSIKNHHMLIAPNDVTCFEFDYPVPDIDKKERWENLNITDIMKLYSAYNVPELYDCVFEILPLLIDDYFQIIEFDVPYHYFDFIV